VFKSRAFPDRIDISPRENPFVFIISYDSDYIFSITGYVHHVAIIASVIALLLRNINILLQ